VHDVVASVTRPVRELKGFRRIHLKRGERTRVEFSLGPIELSFYDGEMRRTVEPGRFDVMIGGSSSGKSQAGFEVVAP
jgi:beta-glucosidase